MQRLTIRLPDDLDQALRERAARDCESIAFVVRTALTDFLQPQREIGFIALGESGQTDTAQRSEEILSQEWNTPRHH